MNELLEKFQQALQRLDKARCVELALNALQSNTVDIPTLYEEILAKSMSRIATNEKAQEIAIWEEHVQSGIVRTVIELCFPSVQAVASAASTRASAARPRAIVFCPTEEYHELGARMSTDFLNMLGFDAYFIGANTPQQEVLVASIALKPALICISVTNFYHLSRLKSILPELRQLPLTPPPKILLGGYAIAHTPQAKTQLQADFYAAHFADLKQVSEAML